MRPDVVKVPARFAQLPRDGRGYPVIATVPQDGEGIDFGQISEARKLVVATYDLCGVCARPFRDELRWLVMGNRDWERFATATVDSAEAPVHEICALYAAQVCPFVSSPFARLGDDHRRGQRRHEALVLVGFEHITEVKAVESDIQPGRFVLAFSVGGAVRAHVLDNAHQAQEAYAHALSAEAELILDEQEQRIMELLLTPTSHGEDSGGVMAGAAWYIGAGFCPRVGRVMGLTGFATRGEGSYPQIAAKFLRDPDAMEAFEGAQDPSTAAAVRWFRSRTRLPAVLAKWRSDERKRLNRAEQAERADGRNKPTAASKRRAAKSARRKNRR